MMRAGALNRPRPVLAARMALVLASVAPWSCSTIEPGGDPQIAQVVYDDDFFYCQVLPNVIVARSCATGDAAKGDMGGCHSSGTPFRVLPLGPNDVVACDANGKHAGGISQVASSNYGAAQFEMNPDPDSAPLLTHPTQKTTHPRLVFDTNSMEADIIRQWALHSSR
jgi:hypothetical protein